MGEAGGGRGSRALLSLLSGGGALLGGELPLVPVWGVLGRVPVLVRVGKFELLDEGERTWEDWMVVLVWTVRVWLVDDGEETDEMGDGWG